MARVITFSRTFPSYHPKAGQPTHFVEKIVGGLVARDLKGCDTPLIKSLRDVGMLSIEALNGLYDNEEPWFKHHTIRGGHRFKAGDTFSPRVWSGKPYNSKQIRIAPNIQVKRTWDFEMDALGVCSIARPGEQQTYTFCIKENLDEVIARNDGLDDPDFYWWFSRSPDFKKHDGFEGQIICWNEKIEY
jgi:hypothetical protein